VIEDQMSNMRRRNNNKQNIICRNCKMIQDSKSGQVRKKSKVKAMLYTNGSQIRKRKM